MSSATSTDPGLRPWQLFLLAGMLSATAVVLVSNGRSTSSIVVLSITVVAASLVATAAFRSLSPLVSPEDLVPDAPVGGRTRAALEREKALVLRSIKELEFDHAMGKTAAADYEEMRDRLKARAVGLLRQLDAAGFRASVERDLAARSSTGPLAASAASASSSAPAAPTAAPATSRACPSCLKTNASDARFCTGCGTAFGEVCARCATPNEPDARFCKSCGATLAGRA